MSSHHIVRDDQEPALIIANGQSCSSELLGQLLEWSPLVVVLDAAIKRVSKLDLKVDVLIGDFDINLKVDQYRESQYPIEIVYAPDQEKTDLEKAFEFLITRKIPMVNVVWATGFRADHTINNIASIAKYNHLLKIVILDDYSKIFLLPQNFKKWYPKNTILSLVSMNTVSGITTQNLQYQLNNEYLEVGVRSGTSNFVADDGLVSITHNTGYLFLIESND
jgi:thiamine pyrophosphokinase